MEGTLEAECQSQRVWRSHSDDLSVWVPAAGMWGQAGFRAPHKTSGRKKRLGFEVRVFVWVQILLRAVWTLSNLLTPELSIPSSIKQGSKPKSQVFVSVWKSAIILNVFLSAYYMLPCSLLSSPFPPLLPPSFFPSLLPAFPPFFLSSSLLDYFLLHSDAFREKQD